MNQNNVTEISEKTEINENQTISKQSQLIRDLVADVAYIADAIKTQQIANANAINYLVEQLKIVAGVK